MLSEHEAFSRLIDSLRIAESSARAMRSFRPDQSRSWEKIAENFKAMQDACYSLEMARQGRQ